MDYDHGSSYSYDQIHTSPLLDSYDAPYMQVPQILKDQQYAAAASPKYAIKPVATNATYYTPGIQERRAPLASQTIGHNETAEPFCNIRKLITAMKPAKHDTVDINTNGMMTVFIFILILIVVINSVHLKHLTKQVDMLTYKNRDNH